MDPVDKLYDELRHADPIEMNNILSKYSSEKLNETNQEGETLSAVR